MSQALPNKKQIKQFEKQRKKEAQKTHQELEERIKELTNTSKSIDCVIATVLIENFNRFGLMFFIKKRSDQVDIAMKIVDTAEGLKKYASTHAFSESAVVKCFKKACIDKSVRHQIQTFEDCCNEPIKLSGALLSK